MALRRAPVAGDQLTASFVELLVRVVRQCELQPSESEWNRSIHG